MSSDHESCHLCKESLREAVSIPCGHVFCSICLKTYWDHTDPSGAFLCPQCRVTYNKRPAPRRLGNSSRYTSSSSSMAQRSSEAFPPPAAVPRLQRQRRRLRGRARRGPATSAWARSTRRSSRASCGLASYCDKHLKPHYESATFKRHKLICPQHQKGLELFCKTDQMCICVLCTVKEHKGHDMVSAEQERADEQQRLGAPPRPKSREKIHDRLKQMEELKQASSAQQAMQECEKLFSDMLRSIEKMQQEMSKLISSNKRAALSNAEGHMERLTHEIADLRRRDSEITQLSRTEDHIHFIQVAAAMCQATDMLIAQTEAEELPVVSVNPYFSFGQVTKSISDIKQHLNEFGNEELVKVAKTVNKMPFCQLEDKDHKKDMRRSTLKADEVSMYRSMPTQEPRQREDFLRCEFCSLTQTRLS
ncbi:Tripartite motif-containing protein 47 [Merluccius polli]|uniref:Tripartite motif-containing protein 47 n=1 Tax=Merluccius polli TaxID=89951 RepID=A0AA47MM60_MERPO|nr:Tripartite motif-containing protein 47 [Merluccius polli]